MWTYRESHELCILEDDVVVEILVINPPALLHKMSALFLPVSEGVWSLGSAGTAEARSFSKHGFVIYIPGSHPLMGLTYMLLPEIKDSVP